MRKLKCAILLIPVLLVCACGSQDSRSISQNAASAASADDTAMENSVSDNTEAGNAASDRSVMVTASDMFSDRDYEVGYDESESALIQLDADSAVCTSDAVQISGSTVTITDEGTYILSGTLDDGMVIVDTEKTDKVHLVFNGVTIHSETSAPVYILQTDKVFLTLAADTTNTLSNGGAFTAIDENNIDAVIFSKEDLTLNGAGTLVITSPAGHGIVSKDSLKFTSGIYDINCASHAIDGKDEVCIANADITIVSGKDGIHAENTDDATLGSVYIQSGTFGISAEGDGISASSYVQIDDGSFDITSGGGSANAESRVSDSWGNYMGGGRHEGGKMGPSAGEMPSKTGRNEMDGEMPPEMSGNEDGSTRKSGPMGEMPPETWENEINGQMPSKTGENEIDDDMSSETTGNETDSTSIKGIKAATNLVLNGGEFTINSADDAVHSNGSVTVNGGVFEIASGDDAFHADETLTVTDGTIQITESYEGLEGLHVIVSGGDLTLVASDDGINAAGGKDSSGTGGRDGMFGPGSASSSDGSITISGGTMKITASGDGIDANGTLEITGGHIVVSGPNQGDTATLDYDISATITGGTFIGTGASGMAQTFSSSGQGVVSVNVGEQSAGTEITLTDSTGNTVMTYTPDLSFAVVIFSSSDIVTGETYTITIGSSSRECTAS